MKLLLDTHVLLWVAGGSEHLTAEATALIENPDNQPMFSVASIWEVVIKNSLGRDDFKADPRLLRRGLLDNGYLELPITSEHAIAVAQLPSLHKDPFDRILLGQALSEGVLLLTADETVAQYPVSTQKI